MTLLTTAFINHLSASCECENSRSAIKAILSRNIVLFMCLNNLYKSSNYVLNCQSVTLSMSHHQRWFGFL